MTNALFTRFSSTADPLTKIINRAPGGVGITKTASAQFYRGMFDTLELDCGTPGAGQRLASMLQDFTVHQALSPSLSLGAPHGQVVTQKALAAHPGAVARDAKHFGYRADVGGLLVLDFDPPKGATPLSPDELWATLLRLWPEVAQGIVVQWGSGGSLIFDGTRQVVGVSGQRFYIVVQSQAAIRAITEWLNEAGWPAGHGHIHVSASGSLLPRPLFDAAMADAGGRLDFAPAGSICRDGLEQRRGVPTVRVDGKPLAAPEPHSPNTKAEVLALIEAAKRAAEPEAAAKRAAWLAERQQVAVMKAASTGADVEEARQRVKAECEALQGGTLLGSAEVIHVDDCGVERAVTVDQLQADPKAWHGKKFLSPHDPDHRGRSPDAVAYLLQGVPVIYDLNDCITYRLQRQPVRLQVTTGSRSQLADQIAATLAKRDDLFNVAGQLVRVAGGEFVPVSRALLGWLIGTSIALFRQGREKPVPVDVDPQTVDQVAALLPERVRRVKGRSSIPLIDPTGRIIDQPGLDEASGFYVDLPTAPDPVPAAPSRQQTVEALRRLWKPVSLYRWDTPHCAAAVLATLLTIPMRPTISAAPGLCTDSALQSSGKSSILRAVLELAQGHGRGLKVWTGDGEIELEKYLLSLARAGAVACAFDNVVGTFDSSTIASALTEGVVQARALHTNNAEAPTFRALWLASSNQAALGRDLGTRFLQARVSCPDGNPQFASFPWSPSEVARADRMGIIRAVMVVHRAWHAAGCPRADGIDTRFATWGRTIRAMVQWLASSGIAEEAGLPALGDPADSILNRVAASDPATEQNTDLFAALADEFGIGDPFTAGDLATVTKIGMDSTHPTKRAVADAVMGFFPRAYRAPAAQALSRVLHNRREHRYAGVMLQAVAKATDGRAARQGQQFVLVPVGA